MNANDKAKFLADQCKPCSKDFYDGVYQGAKIAVLAEQETSKKTVLVLEKILKDEFITIETRNEINNILKLL